MGNEAPDILIELIKGEDVADPVFTGLDLCTKDTGIAHLHPEVMLSAGFARVAVSPALGPYRGSPNFRGVAEWLAPLSLCRRFTFRR